VAHTLTPPGGWPRITIVTPSFNQGWALERCLRSVLAQGYPNLQYIVMDGGSTDESVGIIHRYADRLAHWRSGPDGGQSAAIADGMALADGSVVGYLNSDDVLEPGSLDTVGRAFAEGAAWVIGWSRLVDEHDGELMRRSTLPVKLPDLVRHRYVIPQEATFISRALYDASGGIDRGYRYAMDAHLWMRLMSLAEPTWVQRYLGCFRVHSDQKTMHMDRYWAEFNRAINELHTWRSARALPRLGSGCPAAWFTLRKFLHYLRHTGASNLYMIRRFRIQFRT